MPEIKWIVVAAALAGFSVGFAFGVWFVLKVFISNRYDHTEP